MGVELGIAALLLSGAGAISSASQANIQKKSAESKRQEQVRQAQMQNRLSEANRRRSARITAAKSRARGAASGTTGSILDAPLVGLDTATQSQIDITGQQTESQIQQFNIAAAQTASAANAQIGEALGSFASSVVTTETGLNKKDQSLTEVFGS